MPDWTHKRGDSFSAELLFEDSEGNAVDMPAAGFGVTSSIQTSGERVNLIVVAATRDDKPILRLSAGSTIAWQTGPASWDVQFEKDGDISSSDTVTLSIIEDVTP